jgi:anthranilate phosphoribosyltransferase
MADERPPFAVAPLLETLCAGRSLTRDQARELFEAVVAGELGDVELAAVLVALKTKGETVDEIAGAAAALRARALAFDTGDRDVADSCGTGGDGAHTLNLSTAAALVAAEGGVAIAKHGNRSISSRCGSADVLESLGIAIDAPPALARRCLDEVGICFLFAPQYHAGVRHAMTVRRALGVRTMFNLLGPLANPASPRIQLVGVYDPERLAPLAATLGMLGCRSALVVHGGGLDEIALHDETRAALFSDGEVRMLSLSPEAAGVGRHPLEALRGGAPEHNAARLEELLGGGGDAAHRDAVAINAGALLWLSGRAVSHRDGTAMALSILEQGNALDRLARWRKVAPRA